MAHTILVAEDGYIDGVDITDTCMEAGFEVEGPHAGICSAMLALQKQRPDLAIVDPLLDDGAILEFAQKLHDENVPIIFHAEGDAARDAARRFPEAAKLAKPCPPTHVIDTIQRMIDTA